MCTPRLVAPPGTLAALRARAPLPLPARASPVRALVHLPLTAPHNHTQRPSSSAPCSRRPSHQVVLDMQGPGGLFLLRERHRAGRRDRSGSMPPDRSGSQPTKRNPSRSPQIAKLEWASKFGWAEGVFSSTFHACGFLERAGYRPTMRHSTSVDTPVTHQHALTHILIANSYLLHSHG